MQRIRNGAGAESSFPYTIGWSQEHLPAIVQMTHNSQEEGHWLAAALFGDYNPGGRLTQTWPTSMEQLPPIMDYDIWMADVYVLKEQAAVCVWVWVELYDFEYREAAS